LGHQKTKRDNRSAKKDRGGTKVHRGGKTKGDNGFDTLCETDPAIAFTK
jgi:hypothetical protein